ncbi:MAG: hypothetical protein H7263_12025 [Candidatus Sericytochromatia bacterium]|nr:hypothetical protein [Candidatus Sericytochromatia bacterium]
MKKIHSIVLTSALIIAPLIFTGCKNDEAKQDDASKNSGNTVTDSGTKAHNVAKQQNLIDQKDKNVPDGVKDKYIRDREIVGAGKKEDKK